MNTPQSYGLPVVETTTTVRKEVRMVMTNEQHKEAILEWLKKNHPHFKNMDAVVFEVLVLNDDHEGIEWEDFLIELIGHKTTSSK